jgi:hypothetical protein
MEPTPDQGPTGATGPTEPVIEVPTGSTGPTGPSNTISLQDILSSVEVIQNQEAEDKAKLEGIGTISFNTLKASLIQWANTGFPNAYEIHRVYINPPSVCSDGVVRNLADYIVFCSGKTIHEHVDVLHQRTPDIEVSFANMGGYIGIVVSK